MDFSKNRIQAEAIMDDFADRSFIIKDGTGAIMFSAPHSVEQLREGKPKYSEPQTGLLAEMLHNELGCPIIRKTANFGDDANYDAECKYKDALSEYVKEHGIKFLIDLHQLAPYRDVMINFGTGNWQNMDNITLLNIFLSVFSKNALGSIQIDEPFDASYEHTVSATIHRKCGIPCMQIEMNTGLLSDDSENCAIETVYKALCQCYLKLTEFYSDGENL